ncbi:MAG: SLC13 family permease [Deltaproteobacteria bacterium]|nr:SLC13 family permease [Deltaproteobacteria bacterium]
MSDMTVVFLILGSTIALFVWGRFSSDLVAVGSLLALYLTGLVDMGQALAGFSNSTVILVGSLFVVGEGLTRTGVTAWAGELLIAGARGSALRLLVVMMAGTAVLSAFVSNTGTVATLMPAVVIAAWGVRSVPSAFLIPLAFAANAGGVLTLTGTPPNVIVAEALDSHGYTPFHYFEYSYIGVPLLLTAILYMVAIGQRLLPERASGPAPRPLEGVLDDLAETYAIEGELYRLHVLAGSPLVGTTLRESPLASGYGIRVLSVGSLPDAESGRGPALLEPLRSTLAALRSQPELMPRSDQKFAAGDVLTISGSREAVHRAEVELRLGVLPAEETAAQLSELLSRELGIAEVLLTPRSRYIGEAMPADRILDQFGVVVLGARRGTRQLDADAELLFGDSFLVKGTWETIGKLQDDHPEDLVVVGRPEEVASQVTRLSTHSIIAIGTLVGMVALMVSGAVPVAIAAMLAAGVMILSGCIDTRQAYRAVSWSTVMLIAGMLPMATALEASGGAEKVANLLVSTLGSLGPVAVLAGVFVVTTTLSQVMSNTATAVLMSPIVLTAATGLGVEPYPLMMTIAVAASTAFLTPIGTTTNLMVLGPGEYRFGDYAKVGGPLVAIFLVICMVLIPIFWPF